MISIIIPTYNRAGLISETLESVLAQSNSNWECVLVDDGSEDETWTFLEKYAGLDNRFRAFKRTDFQEKKGANVCRNIGINLSRGEYLIFFDSDDLMLPNLIENHFQMIKSKGPDMSMVQSVYFSDENDFEPLIIKGDLYDPKLTEKFFKKEIVWLISNPAILKSFLIKNSIKFNESLAAGQDWEFFMKILLQNPIIHLIDGIHIRIRIHLQTISHDEEKKTEKYYNYCYARHLIFNHHLNSQQKSNLKDYYKAYTNQFLTEILKYKRPDLALKIIESESSGINYVKNKLYLFLYRLSGKGISKIKI